MQNQVEAQITLSDGRKLGYRLTGDPDGRPLLYFHGFPGSRLEADWLCNDASGCDWRIYALDRPGMGLSDYLPGRTLRDWPCDVAEFANTIGLGKFSILGVSGGAPYAAACAWAMQERLRAVGLVCGLGPVHQPENLAGMRSLNRVLINLLHRFPKLSRPAYSPFAFFFKRWPLALLDLHTHSLPPSDRAVLAMPEFREILSGSFQESVRGGAQGGEHELQIFSDPWGFDVREIRVPVSLWHGERDQIVPCAMGRRLAELIPDCRSTFCVGDGHYSLLVHWRRDILAGLRTLADARP